MGAAESKNPNFIPNLAVYKGHIDRLATESPSRVFNRLTTSKFQNYQEMWAIAMLIYEKAVTQPELSLKCAQLVKELEAENHVGDRLSFFKFVFMDFFLSLIKSVANVYKDGLFSSTILVRFKRASTLLGNLYLVDACSLIQIAEVVKTVKPKETPSSKFFLETVFDVIADKINQQLCIDRDDFWMFMQHFDVNVSVEGEIDTEEVGRFVDYVQDLSNNEVTEYMDFSYFKDIENLAFETNLKILVKELTEVGKQDLATYRDIAKEFHFWQPEKFSKEFPRLLRMRIEQLEVAETPKEAEIITIGPVIDEFFSAGLIGPELVDYFLNTAKRRGFPWEVFSVTFQKNVARLACFMDVQGHVKFLRDNLKAYPNYKNYLTIIEEFLKNFKSQEKIFALDSTGFLDLKEHIKERNSGRAKSTSFECAAKPSCHLAALRGIDILFDHIGSPFFSESNIQACVRKLKKMTNSSIVERVSQKVGNQIFTLKPYFNGKIVTGRKFEQMICLFSVLFQEGLLRAAYLEIVILLMTAAMQEKKQKHKSVFWRIFVEFFEKVGKDYRRFCPDTFKIASDCLIRVEAEASHFKGLSEPLRDFIDDQKRKEKFSGRAELPNVNSSNYIPAVREVARYLSAFCEVEMPKPSFVVSLLAALAENPAVNEIHLQNAFAEALNLQLELILIKITTKNEKLHKEANSFIDLIEFMSKKEQMTRHNLMLAINIIVKNVAMALPRLPKENGDLVYKAVETLNKFVDGREPLALNLLEIVEQTTEDLKKLAKIMSNNITQMKRALRIFSNIVEVNKKKRQEIELSDEDEDSSSRCSSRAASPVLSTNPTIPVELPKSTTPPPQPKRERVGQFREIDLILIPKWNSFRKKERTPILTSFTDLQPHLIEKILSYCFRDRHELKTVCKAFYEAIWKVFCDHFAVSIDIMDRYTSDKEYRDHGAELGKLLLACTATSPIRFSKLNVFLDRNFFLISPPEFDVMFYKVFEEKGKYLKSLYGVHFTEPGPAHYIFSHTKNLTKLRLDFTDQWKIDPTDLSDLKLLEEIKIECSVDGGIVTMLKLPEGNIKKVSVEVREISEHDLCIFMKPIQKSVKCLEIESYLEYKPHELLENFNLEVLKIKQTSSINELVIDRFITTQTNLKVLELNKVDDDILDLITSNLLQLEELIIQTYQESLEDFDDIASLEKLRILKIHIKVLSELLTTNIEFNISELHVKCSEFFTTDEDASFFTMKFPKVKKLHLDVQSKIGDLHEVMSHLQQLEELTVVNHYPREASRFEQLNIPNEKLKVFKFSGKFLLNLDFLRSFPNLTELDLTLCDEESVKSQVEGIFRDFPKLKSILLTFNSTYRVDFDILSLVNGNSNLEFVFLSHVNLNGSLIEANRAKRFEICHVQRDSDRSYQAVLFVIDAQILIARKENFINRHNDFSCKRVYYSSLKYYLDEEDWDDM